MRESERHDRLIMLMQDAAERSELSDEARMHIRDAIDAQVMARHRAEGREADSDPDESLADLVAEVSLPESLSPAERRTAAEHRAFERERGRPPTPGELSVRLGVSRSCITGQLAAARAKGARLTYIRQRGAA